MAKEPFVIFIWSFKVSHLLWRLASRGIHLWNMSRHSAPCIVMYGRTVLYVVLVLLEVLGARALGQLHGAHDQLECLLRRHAQVLHETLHRRLVSVRYY